MGERPDEADVPLADLVDRVDERRQRAARESAEDRFEERPFEELADGSVWTEAEGETPATSAFGAGGDVVETGERTHVVEKRSFCERCPHFAEPPRASCTHPGTEIRAFVDKDHVRVTDCPVVAERGALVGESGD